MTAKQKQCLLNFLGYDTGGVDGIWGDKSRHATECCQEDLEIPADGIWGEQTETAVLKAVSNYDDLDATDVADTNVGRIGTFWDHIRYWSREEFKCRCGEYHAPYCDGFPAEPDQTLVELLDDIRAHFGRPAHRSSGLRCPQHNRDSKGVSNSKHLTGKAMDFFVEGNTGETVRAYAATDPRCAYAYVIEGNYVHVEVK
jgi:hypothetical protein